MAARLVGKHGESLGEHRRRTAAIGVGQRRARKQAATKVVVVMRIGVPGRRYATQAAHRSKLGKDQRHQMRPARKRLVIGVTSMRRGYPLEPPPRDRFEKAGENAIPIAHVRLPIF
jgi:hypothetical protein